jgi:alkyl sulfatase BDS1-like metallo-beta-lactamase superfamily hydrolase
MITPTPPASAPRPSLWRRLRHAWAAFMGRVPRSARFVYKADAELVDTAPSPLEPQANSSRPQGQRGMVPYNTQALPAAREQWQRGDWASLASLTLDELQDHPDRAKLALLAAAGHMQLGRNDMGADCLRQAKAWGCSPQLMRQVVIAGVHNTLGKAAALADMPDRADQHFAASLRTVMPMASGQAQVKQRHTTQMQPLELLH